MDSDRKTLEGIQNAVYFLNKIKLNLKIHEIRNTSWSTQIDSFRSRLDELCILYHNNTIDHLSVYHLDSTLLIAGEKIFLPLVKLTESFVIKISPQDRIKTNYLINQLEYIGEYIPIMLNKNLTCIYLQPSSDPCWTLINQKLQMIQVDTAESLQESLSKLEKNFHLGLAYVVLGEEQKDKNIFQRLFIQNYGLVKCLFNQENATNIALKTFTNPDFELAMKLIKSSDNFLLKQTMKLTLPQINYHQVLYIPRLFEPLTFQEIQKEINQPFIKTSPPKLIQENVPQNIMRFNSDSIQVRLLSSQRDIMRTIIDMNLLSSVFQGIQQDNPIKTQQTNTTIKRIVYHIHGGGWVATDSFFHQSYTRKWANYLGDDTLVISIDYRLAPEYTYPYALDDCWQVYLWIVNFASVYLKTNVEQIVITGDSAGGNMALGVTYRAIKQKVRKPDGIFLPYPAITLNLKSFAPSNFNGIIDTLTPFSMIKLALDSYTKISGVSPESDPYLSPAVACDEYLQELPNLTIACGSKDSLKDDMIKFFYRLIVLKQQGKAKLDVKMKVYEGFPHGYLNYDFPGGPVPQVKKLVDDSSEDIKELFLSG